MKRVLSLLVFISLSFSVYVQAQASISFSDSTNIVPDQLDGFKKATKEALGGTQLALNIMGVDAYKDVNAPKLEKQQILEVVMSGNYVITPYIDEDKTVKVIFFSLATDVQKAKIQKVAGSTKQQFFVFLGQFPAVHSAPCGRRTGSPAGHVASCRATNSASSERSRRRSNSAWNCGSIAPSATWPPQAQS